MQIWHFRALKEIVETTEDNKSKPAYSAGDYWFINNKRFIFIF